MIPRLICLCLLAAGAALLLPYPCRAQTQGVFVLGNGTLSPPADTVRDALGLGTAATSNSTDFATAAQGAVAETANSTATDALALAGTANATAAAAVQPDADVVLTGNVTAARDFTVAGNLTFVPAQDGILTITVNGTAAEVAGNVEVTLPDSNTFELIFDDPDYYWSDENNWWNLGRVAPLQGTTAADVATGLRAWLYDYIINNGFLYPDYPSVGGTGADVTITYDSAPVEGWYSSNAALLPSVETQEGTEEKWQGNPAAIRFFDQSESSVVAFGIDGGKMTFDGEPLLFATKPTSNAVNIGDGSYPIYAGLGPWNHASWYFGDTERTTTTQVFMNQFFAGGGNGYAGFNLVSGSKWLSVNTNPDGKMGIWGGSWSGSFPGGVGGSTARMEFHVLPMLDLLEQGASFGNSTETTVPSNPAADTARIFVRDNGSGKTQLCVIFSTGNVTVLATQP